VTRSAQFTCRFTRSEGEPVERHGSSAVVRSVNGSGQSSTTKFWTKARLDSATLAGTEAATARTVTAEAPPGTPDPVRFNGVRTVGALLYTTGSKADFCPASVVDSATPTLILTATHCVYAATFDLFIQAQLQQA
jgi:hypothetical protein